MAPRTDKTPVIAVVGQTATGKTDLAIYLARKFPGEIIAADSRTIYKGLSIGTAKPTVNERLGIRHHCLDIINPDQSFSAADFQRVARECIQDIGSRNGIAYLVGGSGLYVDGLLYDFNFRPKGDQSERATLERLTVAELQSILLKRGIELPANSKNPRHLIRSIQTGGAPSVRHKLRKNALIIGLQADKEVILERLTRRVDAMVEDGLIDEILRVYRQYGWDAPGLQAPGYKAFRDYINHLITLDEAKRQFVHNDAQLAKRQLVWFKRNKDINWISSSEEAVDIVTTFLNK
jgi:tRNA dimethylallyltransferase